MKNLYIIYREIITAINMQISFQWQNVFPYDLQWKGDAECYDKVMEPYPAYTKIW